MYIFDNRVTNPKWAIGFNTKYEDTGVGGSATAGDDKKRNLPDLHDIHIWRIEAEAGDISKDAIYIDGLSEKTLVYDIAI